jgi:hypothetical protein
MKLPPSSKSKSKVILLGRIVLNAASLEDHKTGFGIAGERFLEVENRESPYPGKYHIADAFDRLKTHGKMIVTLNKAGKRVSGHRRTDTTDTPGILT